MRHVIMITVAVVLGTLGAAQSAVGSYRGYLPLIDLVASMLVWLAIIYAGYGLYLAARAMWRARPPL